ncbi:MAG: class I SAM-dependent methyltransferase [Candidatus Levybacteria bacterium]|nr:class I SAM-dependent methyltransferase [Candidatus Levybacteria bacterium]
MAERKCFDPEALQGRLAADAREIQLYESRGIDQVTRVQAGSFLGRTLGQYLEILFHRIGVDSMAYGTHPPTVVDVGCGASVALAGFRGIEPKARLIGIDTRNVLLNTIEDERGREITGWKFFEENRMEFRQDTFLNINNLVPQGYDLLFSVGAFYDHHSPNAPMAYALKLFYEGLRTGGSAFIQANPDQNSWVQAKKCLVDAGIPVRFVASDPAVLRIHALHNSGGIFGTIVLGPKT